MKKLDLTDKLSTNSEGVSSWSDLPVRLLADGKLWGQDPYNETAKAGAGYWQSEWNFEVMMIKRSISTQHMEYILT